MKKRNRLFTFGCSCTGYHYPTWADLIGTKFQEFYNFGLSGMGNRFIQQMVFEANHHKKFTPEDTVLVMFTSFLRNDVWLTDLKWPSRGPVYLPANSQIYNDWWMKNHWSLEWGLMDSWSSVNAVKQLLDNTGVQYKFLNAMPLQGTLGEGTTDEDIFDFDVSDFNYTSLLDIDYPVWHMAKDYGFSKKDLYYTNIDNKIDIDLHPATEMYARYIKEFLPEYYDEQLQNKADSLHQTAKNIFKHLKSNDNFYESVYYNDEFDKIRGKNFGSLRFLNPK